MTVYAVDRALKPGDAAPILELFRADGQGIKLDALKGQVVVVNFWASWCNPCLRELPLLESLHRSLSARKVTVLAINVDEEQRAGIGVVKHLKLTMPVVYDPKGSAVKQFGPEKLPSSYILDKNGTIRFIHEGVIDEKDLKKLEAEILSLDSPS